MAKTSCKKGQYYCNTDKKCKPIPEGYTVREDGFLVKEGWSAKYKRSIDCDNPKGFSQKAHCDGKKKKGIEEESNPRIPRKKGQPAKSKKHSDLYTDEDPKGTIHGLGFKDVATAKASVAKIRKSSRSHAHKIQAAIAMEQRARVMGKTAEAAIFRKYINSMKKKTKAMNEEKKGDHEYEMIRRQTDNIMVAAKRIKKKVDNGEGEVKAWVQSKITKAADYLDTAADYMTDKEEVKEGSLHKWFKGSKSKDGKGGWVNVLTGGTCASDEPGEGVPKCVSRAKYERMTPAERRSAARRKKAADPGQQEKTGAAKPTYVSTDKPKKKRKKKKKMKKESTEFTSLPLVLEVPQSGGEFKCGLMFRESLEQDRGMLFIFESNDYWTFHMKNTFIPLDIAFIKEDGTIDSIKELDPMSPIPVYPDSEIRYAVEVNRGWFAENNVNVGDALLEDIQEHHKKDADGNTIPHEHEEELNEVKDRKGKGSGKKDACYYKVKSRYSVWPSAYASGALVKCRKVGAANWGNKSEGYVPEDMLDEGKSKLVQMGLKAVKNIVPKIKGGNIRKVTVGSGSLPTISKKLPAKVKDFTPTKTGSFTKIGSGSGGSGGSRNFAGRFGDAFKRNAGALTTGGIVGAEIQNAVNQGKIKELESELEDQRSELEMQKRINSYYQGVEDGKTTVKPKPKPATKKDKNINDHYSWRDSIIENDELDEQLLGMLKKAGSAVGSAAQKVGSAVSSAAQKVGSALKPKPIQGRISQSNQNMAGKTTTSSGQQQQQNQSSNSGQQQQKMGSIERANRERLGDDRVDQLKQKNQEFQAAKKSGNLDQYRKDNPQLSGRERAQAMARARIAAKKVQSNSPTPPKPTVDKIPQSF